MTTNDHHGGVSTVFLHVGTMKTGTTYLQSRFKQHRRDLERAGVRYPHNQLHALRDVVGRRGPLGRPDVSGAWSTLLGELREDGADRGVVSMEFLSTLEPPRIAPIISDLAPADVHLVLTVRDIGRVMVAQWQEMLQNKVTWTWPEFAATVTSDEPTATEAGRRFWRQHDVPRMLEQWGDAVGPDHTHIVVVPAAGAPPETLWNRFCELIGVDGTQFAVAEEGLRVNTGIDASSAEFLRRLNGRVDREISHPAYLRHVKQLLGKEVLVGRPGGAKPVLTPSQFEWAERYTDRVIDQIRSSDAHVVGDLDALRPVAPTAEQQAKSGEINDAVVAEVALDVIVALLERLDQLEPMLAGRNAASMPNLEPGAEAESRDEAQQRPRRRRRAGGRPGGRGE